MPSEEFQARFGEKLANKPKKAVAYHRATETAEKFYIFG